MLVISGVYFEVFFELGVFHADVRRAHALEGFTEPAYYGDGFVVWLDGDPGVEVLVVVCCEHDAFEDVVPVSGGVTVAVCGGGFVFGVDFCEVDVCGAYFGFEEVFGVVSVNVCSVVSCVFECLFWDALVWLIFCAGFYFFGNMANYSVFEVRVKCFNCLRGVVFIDGKCYKDAQSGDD